MKQGNVMYNGRIYTILYYYDTGYCEISDIYNVDKIELVHFSELTEIKDGKC